MPKLIKREHTGVLAKFMQRVHDLPDGDRKKLKAAAKQAEAGDTRPIIEFLKSIITNPAMLQALITLLPVLLPLLLAVL